MAEEKELTLTEILDLAISNKPKKKTGLGLVWGNTTQAVGSLSKVVSVLADSGVELAVQAKTHAVIGKVESYKELLSAFNIEAEGAQSVELGRKLMSVLEE